MLLFSHLIVDRFDWCLSGKIIGLLTEEVYLFLIIRACVLPLDPVLSCSFRAWFCPQRNRTSLASWPCSSLPWMKMLVAAAQRCIHTSVKPTNNGISTFLIITLTERECDPCVYLGLSPPRLVASPAVPWDGCWCGCSPPDAVAKLGSPVDVLPASLTDTHAHSWIKGVLWVDSVLHLKKREIEEIKTGFAKI